MKHKNPSEIHPGDIVKVKGPVKYGGRWYNASSKGMVENTHPKGMLVRLKSLCGTGKAICYVTNKRVTLMEGARE